jgi:hypothetical protein
LHLQDLNGQHLDDGWLNILDNSNTQQDVPLLPQQLLQSLQDETQLQQERGQAAGVMQQSRANHQQQQQAAAAAAAAASSADLQPNLDFMPADATPSFVDSDHAAGRQADTMQLDSEPHNAGAAAAAAALRVTAAAAAAAAAHTSHRANGPAAMQLDGPAGAQPLQGWQQQQEQRLLDISMPVAAAEQLQEALEQQLLLDLAADVAADLAPAGGQQQQDGTALAGDEGWVQQVEHPGSPVLHPVPVPGSSASSGGDGRIQSHGEREAAVAAGVGAVPELDGQLGWEDLLGGQQQQQHTLMQEDHDESEQLQLAAEQQHPPQQMSGSRATGAVVAGRGCKLQLAVADPSWADKGSSSSSSRPAAAAGMAAVPQLSAFGLVAEAAPVLPDEPVVLLTGQAQDDQPGHARVFW